MASEDLFQNDFSEEPDLAQDVQQSEDMNMDAEEEIDADADDEKTADDNNTSAVNGDSPTAAAESADDATKTTSNGIKPSEPEHEAKLTQLPMGRIRNIMKLDPDLQIASNEAVFAVTRAVELFIESLARESFTYTAQAKKKTIQKRDVELAISAVDSLTFLDGAMNF